MQVTREKPATAAMRETFSVECSEAKGLNEEVLEVDAEIDYNTIVKANTQSANIFLKIRLIVVWKTLSQC